MTHVHFIGIGGSGLSAIARHDHQPFALSESEKYGIDLHLSGDTHNGQMWPLNYITAQIYELRYGT